MKEKFSIVDCEIDESLPLEWTKIPEEYISKIPGRYLHNILYASEDGELIESTVIFIEPISKLTKGSTRIELDKIIVEL
jgi:hypothetical protein